MRSPKIAIFPTFLFALGTPLWQSRKTLHEWKDSSVLAKPLAACTRYIQQFPSYSNRKCKKLPFSRTAGHIFVSPNVTNENTQQHEASHGLCDSWASCSFPPDGDAVRPIALNFAWSERHACKTPRSMYPTIYNSFQLFEPQLQKNHHFYVPRPSFFCLPGDAPVAITQNVAWMQSQFSACQTPRSMYPSIFNSFPVIRTASAIAVFTHRSPHFCSPWRRPCDYHAICCMDGKTIQCLPNHSQHVLVYLQ